MPQKSLDAIVAVLGSVLMAAPERERQRLARAIEASALLSPVAFRDMRNGHPASSLGQLFREMIEAVDAQPE
jgi:hypothetical protein